MRHFEIVLLISVCCFHHYDFGSRTSTTTQKLYGHYNSAQEYLKNTKKFPLVLDPYSGIPWAPMDPDIIMQTKEYKELTVKDEDERHEYLKNIYDTCTSDAGYERRRLFYACEILMKERLSQLLFEAVKKCDYWLVRLALLYGADPNEKGEDGNSTLLCASTVEMAKLLMNAGADSLQEPKLLSNALRSGLWRLVVFYNDKNIPWNDTISPFKVLQEFFDITHKLEDEKNILIHYEAFVRNLMLCIKKYGNTSGYFTIKYYVQTQLQNKEYRSKLNIFLRSALEYIAPEYRSIPEKDEYEMALYSIDLAYRDVFCLL